MADLSDERRALLDWIAEEFLHNSWAGRRLVAVESATDAPAGAHDGPAPGTLPGLGNATAVRLAASSPSIGRTLKQLDLRGLTGATVIAIDREADGVVYPTGDETLASGDTLILTGTTAAVEAAREILEPAARDV